VATSAASAIQFIERVQAEWSSGARGSVRESHVVLKARAARAARRFRPPSCPALSLIGESILAQSVPVAPAAVGDYAISRIC
jgi:hypothetical protein